MSEQAKTAEQTADDATQGVAGEAPDSQFSTQTPLSTGVDNPLVEGMVRSRELYVNLVDVTRETGTAYGGLLSKTQNAAKVLGERVVDNMEKNTEAVFENAKAVMRCKDMAEAARVQSEFVQKQVAVAGEQIKEMLELCSRISDEIVSAGKTVTNNTVERLKAVA